MDKRRINLGKAAPGLYNTVLELEKLVSNLLNSSGIEAGFSYLLRLRASQINGCAFCLRLHTREAIDSGETTDRISVLPGWRESNYFTETERAALSLVESVTMISEGQVPDSVYNEARKFLSDQQIAAVEWLGVVINVWNRIAIASRYEVNP